MTTLARLQYLGLALAALTWACTESSSPLGGGPAARGLTPATSTPVCVALKSGTIVLGQVCASEDAGEIVLEYSVTGTRRLRGIAAALADDPAGFPRGGKGGVVDVSRFPVRATFTDVPTYTARLPLAGSASQPGGRIYLSAQAIVLDGKSQRTAWGEGTPFPAGSGAYFPFDRPAAAPPPPPPPRLAFLVVGDSAAATTSERRIVARLASLGYDARLMGEDRFSPAAVEGCSVVLISQTVTNAIGARPKPLTCGILFWDDNSQRINFLSTIRNDGSAGSAWHRSDTLLYVIPTAPAEVRAGLAGTVKFYTRSDEISWAPRADLPATATWVARARDSLYNPAIYYYDRGHTLADGTPAAGRRIFFGIYRDSFRVLTPEALALFDAAVAWASN